MSPQRFAPRPAVPALQALDFGLSARVDVRPVQGTLFSGAENLTAQRLSSELAELVSSLRVRSFSLRAELEQVTSALLVNVQYGFWSLAARAALDLGHLLRSVSCRRLADREPSFRGANCAFRIAELCGREVR